MSAVFFSFLNSALYKIDGVLIGGRYLPGAYRWPVPITLTGALLTCSPPSAGTLTLRLYVDGVAVPGVVFTVAATATPAPVQLRLPLSVNVGLGSLVRWWADFDGAPESGATALGLVMQVTGQGPAQPAIYGVLWTNGSERFDLLGYSASTQQFSVLHPELPGLQYAQVTQDAHSIHFSIQGQECFSVVEGVVYAPSFFVLNGLTPQPVRAPRLQFLINGLPAASLTQSGLWVLDLTEQDNPSLNGQAGYQFNSTIGGVTPAPAFLTAQGIFAESFQES